MRWIWIDRITELVPGSRMTAIKNVSLAEEHLHDHFAADGELGPLPVMPASLMIEGMAQTAGVLVGAARDFKEKVILAKIVHAVFEADVFPGDVLRYEAEAQRIDEAGASTTGRIARWSALTGRWDRIGEVELLFSHIDKSMTGLDIPEHNFVFGENLRIILQDAGLRAML